MRDYTIKETIIEITGLNSREILDERKIEEVLRFGNLDFREEEILRKYLFILRKGNVFSLFSRKLSNVYTSIKISIPREIYNWIDCYRILTPLAIALVGLIYLNPLISGIALLVDYFWKRSNYLNLYNIIF